jgi:hypothetical protein
MLKMLWLRALVDIAPRCPRTAQRAVSGVPSNTLRRSGGGRSKHLHGFYTATVFPHAQILVLNPGGESISFRHQQNEYEKIV